jgi:membrane-associated protein
MNPLSAHDWLSSMGPAALLVVMFAETGLLIGFFLPGDSLLFTAGLLTATTQSGLHLSLGPTLVCAVVGALAGAQCGYYIGQRAGPVLLESGTRPKLAAAAERSAEYLDKYGLAKAVVIARFIPIVRTVINPLAGVLRASVRTFTIWQVVGGLVWTIGVILAGHALGTRIPSIDKYLLPIIAVVVAVSLLPLVLEVRRHRRAST